MTCIIFAQSLSELKPSIVDEEGEWVKKEKRKYYLTVYELI